ncbi:hypothetical protein D3C80_1411860 [compost metagenome]
MGDAYVLQLREQLAEQVAAQLDFVFLEVEVFAQAAAEAVAPAGAEHQAVVGGALAVGDLAAVFAEGLALAQTDLFPSGFRQRLGGHQQALHRQLVLTQRWQAGGVALHGGHCPLAANARQWRTHFAGLPVDGRGVLVD